MNAYTFEGEPETEPRFNGHAAGDPWTVPLPLADVPPDLPPFPLKTVGPWAEWCSAQAEAANASVDFVAMSQLTLAGATIANARWGSPWPGWREPPVLFTGHVGLPSSGKSPAIDTVHDPLKEAERRLAGGFDEVHRGWSTRKAEAEATRERWEREVREAVKMGTPAPRMPEGAVTPAEPRPPRLYTTEPTIEAVADLAVHEPKGVALIRDELAGWVGGMDNYGGNGADRAFWLEAYGGRSKVIDRLKYGGRPLRVQHLSAPILGGIQPDKLASMMLAGDDDGLAARFCYTWPALPPLRKPSKRPDPDRLVDAFVALRRLEMAANGETGDEQPVPMPFAARGADVLQAFRKRNRAREQDAAGLFCGWIGKGPGRVVRVACILEHLWWAASRQARAAPPPAEVSKAAVLAAIKLVEAYLTPHAERVFDIAGEGDGRQTVKDAEALANWIANQTAPPTLQRVAQFVPVRRLRRKKARDAVLALLKEKGWLRHERRAGATVLVLNPGLEMQAA